MKWLVLLACVAGCSASSSSKRKADAAVPADASVDDDMALPDAGSVDFAQADAGSDGGCQNLPLAATTQNTDGSCSDYNAQRNVYWGDLHDHTYFSIDSYGLGNRRTPLDAYQYALGVCTNVLGIPQQIDRPLDFVVVSDHSEYIGVTDECFNLDGEGWSGATTPYCQTIQEIAASPWPNSNLIPKMGALGCPEGSMNCIDTPDGGLEPAIEHNDPTTYHSAMQSVWQQELTTADQVYNSHQCKFTSLPAYEWTAAPGGNTFHHIVVFANSTVPAVPLDYLHYDSELALLDGLQAQCTGNCDVITIQHNTNLSGGVGWTTSGTALLEQLRNRYERLVEIHQTKGSSECLNDAADGNDPLCGFEYRTASAGQTPAQVAPGYVRPGLGLGLADWSKNGREAYQFGFVGDTDNHQSTPGNVRESTWQGSVAEGDNSPEARIKQDQFDTSRNNPGGITGVWAEQNLRPNIFAALKRRESFATSGPRIPVRFYQTWNQSTDFCADANFPQAIEAEIAAHGGAIMGSTVVAPSPSPQSSAPPRFVVFALRDPEPDPTNGTAVDLAEVQLIKGVYDPAGSATTVTVQSQLLHSPALPHETGAAFCHTFTDASFDASMPAYYYPRVLQSPTWRWSHYDCAQLVASGSSQKCNNATENIPIQERAWGSPVWYLP